MPDSPTTLAAGGATANRPIDQPCPACGETSLTIFFEEGNVPTNSCLLLEDPNEASDFPRGELKIAFCDSCGFVTNTAFTPGQAEYSQRYEETQGFSPRFMAFATELAEQWVRDYDLADKTVLEIGCGKGEFLVEMAKAGAGHCIGIDPGVSVGRTTSSDRRSSGSPTSMTSGTHTSMPMSSCVDTHSNTSRTLLTS